MSKYFSGNHVPVAPGRMGGKKNKVKLSFMIRKDAFLELIKQP